MGGCRISVQAPWSATTNSHTALKASQVSISLWGCDKARKAGLQRMWILVGSCERPALLQYSLNFQSARGGGVATSILAYWSMSGLISKSAG